jgi:hypothetical protein
MELPHFSRTIFSVSIRTTLQLERRLESAGQIKNEKVAEKEKEVVESLITDAEKERRRKNDMTDNTILQVCPICLNRLDRPEESCYWSCRSFSPSPSQC